MTANNERAEVVELPADRRGFCLKQFGGIINQRGLPLRRRRNRPKSAQNRPRPAPRPVKTPWSAEAAQQIEGQQQIAAHQEITGDGNVPPDVDLIITHRFPFTAAAPGRQFAPKLESQGRLARRPYKRFFLSRVVLGNGTSGPSSLWAAKPRFAINWVPKTAWEPEKSYS